jgi:Na+-transporting NADH:ubiquinone oxidoreductase subunit F
MVKWARILVLGHVALAVVFIYFGQWILIPIVLLPFFYGTWLSLVVGVPQHAGLQDNVPDFRRSCRTVRQDRFTRYCY